jgi:pyruvate,water dikinase
MEKFVLPFASLSKASVAIAGGKGAQLGEMTAAGIPVPPGFVVSVASFDEFIRVNGLGGKIAIELAKVDQHNTSSVDAASKNIRSLIESADIPQDMASAITAQFNTLGARFVAVRSSATAEDASAASWAGELESYLNTTGETLLPTVRKCWASLFTPRAIFYRFEQGLEKAQVGVGVVVQKMVESEVSGVAFTVNPVTRDRNQMVIEAGFGLGEAIVGGLITPDKYVVDKAEEMLLDVQVNEQEEMIVRGPTGGTQHLPVPADKRAKQKLSGLKVLELSRLCNRIEVHYGSPQDLEWALESGVFYIVQARPVTTL